MRAREELSTAPYAVRARAPPDQSTLRGGVHLVLRTMNLVEPDLLIESRPVDPEDLRRPALVPIDALKDEGDVLRLDKTRAVRVK